MGRLRRMQKRARRARELMARRSTQDRLLWGYSMEMIEWRRPLPRGLILPFWQGLPLVSVG